MLRWWIKLSPTTSAKSVNLTLSPSITAQVIHIIFLILMTWAVTLSDIPIVLSIYLLLMIAKRCFEHGSVVPASQGRWYVHCDGTVRSESRKTQLRRADISAFPLKVSFTLGSGDSVSVWRDSCSDQQYRQLVVVLRQWQMKQGAEAPC